MAENEIRFVLPKMPGEKLSTAELEDIRSCLESMDSFDGVTPEMAKLIRTQWPDLAAKLPSSNEN